ncbi:unnamed protein product, partial [Trichobilharzia szidati]
VMSLQVCVLEAWLIIHSVCWPIGCWRCQGTPFYRWILLSDVFQCCFFYGIILKQS